MKIKKDSPSKPSVIRLNIRATPLPTDPVGADDFYRALGILTVAWGRLEGHFTFTLLNLMRIAGPTVVDHVLPVSWKGRADVWKKAFKSVPHSAALEESATKVLRGIIDTAQDRHVLLHAMWEGFHVDAPPRIDIVSVKHKKSTVDGLDFRRATITLEMLNEITATINHHNEALAEVSRFLSSHYPAPKDARTI